MAVEQELDCPLGCTSVEKRFEGLREDQDSHERRTVMENLAVDVTLLDVNALEDIPE
jgi:hypothetical protein